MNLNSAVHSCNDYDFRKLFRLRETSPTKWENKEIFTCGKDVCFNDLTPDFERNILSFGEDDEGKTDEF